MGNKDDLGQVMQNLWAENMKVLSKSVAISVNGRTVLAADGHELVPPLSDLEVRRSYWDEESQSMKTEIISREEFLDASAAEPKQPR